MKEWKPFVFFGIFICIPFLTLFIFATRSDRSTREADKTWKHWERRGQGVSRFHDDEKHVTCWAIYSGGSCIPDSQLK